MNTQTNLPETAETPNWKKGIKVGFLFWFISFIFVFSLIYFYSTLPAVTEVSLSISLQPWWKLSNWLGCLIITSPIFMIITAREALIKKKKR